MILTLANCFNMKYSSIREYFNSFYNTLYGILLVPLLAFAYLYLEQQAGNLETKILENNVVIVVLAFFVLMEWVVSFILFNKGIKQACQLIALVERLEKYRTITIVRYVIISSSCLLLAIGFYLTTNQALTAMFVMGMILQSSFWPTTYRLANQLKLNGEEREMIIHKKDFSN